MNVLVTAQFVRTWDIRVDEISLSAVEAEKLSNALPIPLKAKAV